MTPYDKAEIRMEIIDHLEELLADLTMGDEDTMGDKELGEYLDAMHILATAIVDSMSMDIISSENKVHTVSLLLQDVHQFVDGLDNKPIVE